MLFLLGLMLIHLQGDLKILWPPDGKVSSNINVFHIAGSFNSDVIDSVYVFTSYQSSRIIPVLTQKDKKEIFPSTVADMFPDDFILKRFTIKITGRKLNRKLSYEFKPQDMVDIEKFWYSESFKKIYASIFAEGATTAKVEIEGWIKVRTRIEDEYFFSTVYLKPGLNEFLIYTQDKSGKLTYVHNVKIFRNIDDLLTGDFDTASFHGSGSDEICSDCHDFSLTDPEDTNVSEDECTTCHSGFMKSKIVHPPVEEWECLTCHKKEGSKFKITDEFEEISELCLSCHSDMEDVEANTIHPPFDSGECLTCHDPHSSNFSYLTSGTVNKICLQCHELNLNAHPVVNHPLEANKDPIEPDKKFTCVSCHDPHFSDSEKLLRIRKENSSFCEQCHNF